MTAVSVEKKINGTEPRFDPRALAEAEATRIKAAAEAEAIRIEAEGKAEAEKIKAAEEARKQKIVNDKAEARAREEQAARDARIAKHNRERKEQEQAAREAEEKVAAQEQAEAEKAAEIAAAEEQWRNYALRFYAVCSIVALPVQIAAFYNPNALWLLAAPLMLEGGAWVVLKGARAAAISHRPHWHYRLIAWLLAFIAAGINLWHGLNAFDPATAIGTAFASIAGPGVYDLYEHGQLRKREGRLSLRQRRAKRKAERAAAAWKATEEKRRAAVQAAAEQAEADRLKKLAENRSNDFPEVWKHALKLAAALGETTVTEPIWIRAHVDIEGCEPGDSVDIIRTRNANAKRVELARESRSVNTLSKTVNAQRVPHLPPTSGRGSKTGPKVRGVRRSGDAPKYSDIARKQAQLERTIGKKD
ncbi:cell envelope integrity protein TolA [Streptomyces sp. NPDC101166]|uniref:cell envelope integrity protein TolA n=1 Tax=Streptomyces sp. NPDC101166 TaxID=3366120 RepID=UPI003809EA64